MEDCEKFFTELVERKTSELRERIQAQEGAMLREAEGHLQTMEAELVELRRAEAEHKPLAPTDERPHFFQVRACEEASFQETFTLSQIFSCRWSKIVYPKSVIF